MPKRKQLVAWQRNMIAWDQDWKCANCCEKLHFTYEIDHKIALADGGADIIQNMQALCAECHRTKSLGETSTRANTTMSVAPMNARRSDRRLVIMNRIEFDPSERHWWMPSRHLRLLFKDCPDASWQMERIRARRLHDLGVPAKRTNKCAGWQCIRPCAEYRALLEAECEDSVTGAPSEGTLPSVWQLLGDLVEKDL